MNKHQRNHKKTAPAQDRRRFLRNTTTAAAAIACLPLTAGHAPGTTSTPKYRAAIIGHTGRGDYGHNLDLIFAHRKDVTVVAVADPVAEGRAQAARRSGAARQYADYREMLSAEKPDLVSIAPRWSDQHHAMALAALRARAHVFIEKPFTVTMAEADELVAVAEKGGQRITVAHQMRLAPEILSLKAQLDAGLIGDLLEIQAHGKQDKRAGCEDMVVLGIHLFDLMRLFAGDPEWCTARILERGQSITLKSSRAATEDIGPVAGDEVFAQFAFPAGVNATFTSRGRLRNTSGPWGMSLVGSEGAVRILADAQPRVYCRKDGDWPTATGNPQWQPLKSQEAADPEDSKAGRQNLSLPNQRLVDDWLEAIAARSEPACSGRAAMLALEMAMAVLEAGVRRERITFPLSNRRHPLAKPA